MAKEPAGLSPSAQAAAIRQMLTDDPTLTLEGVETTYPYLAEGAKLLLSEEPQPARSGSEPMQAIVLASFV